MAADWGNVVETTALARTATVAATPEVARGPRHARVKVGRPRWLRTYIATLVVLDGTAMAAATLTAKISWLGINPEELHVRSFSIPYGALALATVPTWLVLLALAGAYDLGPFGSSSGAWTHVVRAGAQLLAVVAVAYYIVHLAMLGRGVLAGMIPLAVALTLGARAVAGHALERLRRRGHARRTALLLGTRRGVDAFDRQLDGHPAAGVTVIGRHLLGDGSDSGRHVIGDIRLTGQPVGPPVPADPAPDGDATLAVAAALAATGAETLIVTGGLAPGQLRDIAWALEGTGVELLVIPTPADIEGLQSEIRPIAGLPLLYLDG